MNLKSFLKKHWKKIVGVAVAVSGVFYPPALAVTVPLGSSLFGSDFQLGTQIGTPIGQSAKELADLVNGTKRKP